MLARNVTKSKKILQLSDQQRVIWAFIIPFLDREGRINAHPTYLKGQVFLALEYTEAQIKEATDAFHDVGLATVYNTEDDLVMQYTAFHEFNKPNHKESPSEFPAPSDELANRVEVMPSTPRKNVPQPMPGQCLGNAGGEVEVEVEVEGGGEGEGTETQATNRLEPTVRDTPPPPVLKLSRDQNSTLNFIRAKLRRRKDPNPDDLFDSLLDEDPSRQEWFSIQTQRARQLADQADKTSRSGGRFQTEFIRLLDAETREPRLQARAAGAAGPPVSRGAALVAALEAEYGF